MKTHDNRRELDNRGASGLCLSLSIPSPGSIDPQLEHTKKEHVTSHYQNGGRISRRDLLRTLFKRRFKDVSALNTSHTSDKT